MECNCLFRHSFGYTTVRDEPAFVEESFLSQIDEIYAGANSTVSAPVYRPNENSAVHGVLDLGKYYIEIKKIDASKSKNLVIGNLFNKQIQTSLLNVKYLLRCYPLTSGVTHPAEVHLNEALKGSERQIFEFIKNSDAPDLISILSRLKIRDSLFHKVVVWGLSSRDHHTRDNTLSLIESCFLDDDVKKALKEACEKERISYLKENMKSFLRHTLTL